MVPERIFNYSFLGAGSPGTLDEVTGSALEAPATAAVGADSSALVPDAVQLLFPGSWKSGN